MKKIIPSLTSAYKDISLLEKEIQLIDKYHIKEMGLFLTTLKLEDRKKIYHLIEQTKLYNIPHVHLRHDYERWELDYLAYTYKTRIFNMHPIKDANDFLSKNETFRKNIYVENLLSINKEFVDSMNKCGGICLDISHYEDGLLCNMENYKFFDKILQNSNIGCCHVSAISKIPLSENVFFEEKNQSVQMTHYSTHFLNCCSELDYLKKYIHYLPNIITIELINPLSEQLEIKKYIEEIIGT